MTLALIKVSPPTIIRIFPNGVADINVPGNWQQQGALVGWQSPDGAYKLVAVVPFVPPGGQSNTGQPSYAIDAGGVVTETYSTIPTPTPTIVASGVLLARLTGAEAISIYKAANTAMVAGNPQYMFWLTAANSRGYVDISDPATVAAKAAIVAAGLLTQARADAVFVV